MEGYYCKRKKNKGGSATNLTAEYLKKSFKI